MSRANIIWSTRAARDFKSIQVVIADDKIEASYRFIRKIKKSVEALQKFPFRGRTVPELSRSDIREIIVGNYRVIYKIKGKAVFILTVFVARRNWQDAWLE